MNLDLKIVYAKDFLKSAENIQILRNKTLDQGHMDPRPSGMNIILNNLIYKIIPYRDTTTKFILAYIDNELAGWALLTKDQEHTNVCQLINYKSNDGTVFNIYIEEHCRRFGIAKTLLFTASAITKESLIVIPWDEQSFAFYSKYNKQLNLKSLGFKFENQ